MTTPSEDETGEGIHDFILLADVMSAGQSSLPLT
jgi:hypothetical protein